MSRKVQTPHCLTKNALAVLFTKTPAEHLEAYRSPKVSKTADFWAYCTGREVLPQWNLPPPPPGHIRVKWYTSTDEIGYICGGELEANVPLEPNGALDLNRLHNLWGMDNCVAVNPWRKKTFQPNTEYIISALAIHCLQDDEGAIRLIEEPSEQVKRIREKRWEVITFFREDGDAPYRIALAFMLFLYLLYRWIDLLIRDPPAVAYTVWKSLTL